MKYTLNNNAKKISNYRFFNELKSLPFVEKILLFGSKAKNSDTFYSDIDIALSLSKNHSKNDWLAVNDIIRNADTLLKVDCLDLNSLQDNSILKNNIFSDSIIMFDKSSDKLLTSYHKLSNALDSLESAINSKPTPNRIHIDATIQRFEFSIELFWLLLREIIRSKGVDNASFPKDVLIVAFSHRLITDEQLWLSMLDDRNKTSHTYDEKLADEIYSRIKSYFPVMKLTLLDLKKNYYPNQIN